MDHHTLLFLSSIRTRCCCNTLYLAKKREERMKRGNEKESRKTEHSASFVDRTVQTAEEEDGDSPKSVLLSHFLPFEEIFFWGGPQHLVAGESTFLLSEHCLPVCPFRVRPSSLFFGSESLIFNEHTFPPPPPLLRENPDLFYIFFPHSQVFLHCAQWGISYCPFKSGVRRRRGKCDSENPRI